ncbi:MAG: hypothetical protein NXI31_21665 [bacterium]|nr:hypothetical protein [bacterium]
MAGLQRSCRAVSIALAAGLVLAACAADAGPDPIHQGLADPSARGAVAFDGRVLAPQPIAAAMREKQERLLATARAELAQRPRDRGAAIWVGRRLGYLARYREAIAVYTRALAHHPRDPYLLRHRGHRHISLRQLDRAIADLELAARQCRHEPDCVEPDGLPTPGRPPHSSLHFNVHYHLGLAHFLNADFAAAERAWLDCLAVCDDDESRVAVSHWLWSVRMRRDDPAGAQAVVAALGEELDVVENTSYLRLCRLYAGRLPRTELVAGGGSAGAALAFGLAHHELVTGDESAALRQLDALARRPGWAAFGVIAAEAELSRRRSR